MSDSDCPGGTCSATIIPGGLVRWTYCDAASTYCYTYDLTRAQWLVASIPNPPVAYVLAASPGQTYVAGTVSFSTCSFLSPDGSFWWSWNGTDFTLISFDPPSGSAY
jgi:hypothetical protein